MMKVSFTKEEIQGMRDIIDQYRDVSKELYTYQKKAEEIQEKVISLEKDLGSIKEKEDKMMDELHNKYGEFTLQDIYEAIK